MSALSQNNVYLCLVNHYKLNNNKDMKKIVTRVAALALAAMLLPSCAAIGSSVGGGLLYTGVKDGVTATSNPLGTKVGTAKASNILGVVAMGDASIQAAANSAGIKKISHVDVEKKSLLGLFSSCTIYVYGE